MNQDILLRQNGYLPVSDIVENYPDVSRKMHWDSVALGRLYSYGVVDGVRTSQKRTYIKIDSLRALVNFINARIEAQKVSL